ncbi:helix-turn-helix domain-containing protein [Leuconostoc mesenteroides]|uniref:helix-turn-helix domain-containing protein n=1 Tax=Leuconostoc mesenteroides TaxID=1245 RepID=UPI002361550E|nr:helix-turn-helix domain-containing protein [Leuconostoc mesenteroides]
MEKEQDIKYFTQIPAWVDELDNISDFQARLIGYIYTFENITGSAFPSNQRIATRFGKTQRGVQNALSDLYKKDIITSEVVYKSGTKEIEKRYLRVKRPYTSKNDGVYIENDIGYTSKMPDPIHRKCVDNKSINKSINRLNNNNVHFEEIWSLYPKKSGKKVAEREFNKAIKNGVNPDDIKNKILEYNKQIEAKQTPKQFIKQGSTWFNQACWEDEYDLTPINGNAKEPMKNGGYGTR